MQVGRIEVDVGVTAEIQRPVQEGLHPHVEALADAAHLRFGDAALASQRCHHLIDFAGGNAGDVDLHHDGPQGPIHLRRGSSSDGKQLPSVTVGCAARSHRLAWSGADHCCRCGVHAADPCAHGAIGTG